MNAMLANTSMRKSYQGWVHKQIFVEVYGENEGKSNKERLKE